MEFIGPTHINEVSRMPACSANSLLRPIFFVVTLLFSHLFQSSWPTRCVMASSRTGILVPDADDEEASSSASYDRRPEASTGLDGRGLKVPCVHSPPCAGCEVDRRSRSDWSEIKGVDSLAKTPPRGDDAVGPDLGGCPDARERSNPRLGVLLPLLPPSSLPGTRWVLRRVLGWAGRWSAGEE
jgi:hypothetical protein